MKIAIYGSRRQYENAKEVRTLVMNLVLEGAETLMHEKLYDHLLETTGETLPGVSRVTVCPSDANLVLSIGGDGTLLRTVTWTQPHEIPVLGINTGHLGYLTALSLSEAMELTTSILNLDFRREELTMIAVSTDDKLNPIRGAHTALNEVVVAKEDSASMINAITRIDNTALADYKADGLIVSTPTGSTAYNLSVGGPIVQPGAPVWVISPIAAHSLTLRPIVVNDSTEISIKVEGRGARFRLVLDGRITSLPMGTTVTLKKAPHRAIILQCRNRNFADIIGAKLLFNG